MHYVAKGGRFKLDKIFVAKVSKRLTLLSFVLNFSLNTIRTKLISQKLQERIILTENDRYST